jgi:RNA polymerase sigma-70 factor (ECF subfamily)
MTHAGDAFRSLYDVNHARVRRTLARIVGPQEAEDLTQTVFAKAAKALPTFRGDADSSTWLHRIAANVASDWLHSRSTQEAKLTVPLPGPSDDDTGVPLIELADADGEHSPEIGNLPETLRIVFMLNALGGLSDDEIARTLGISHSNTKVRLHRARQEFKKIIEARCDFYRNELSCKPTSPDCCAPAANKPL